MNAAVENPDSADQIDLEPLNGASTHEPSKWTLRIIGLTGWCLFIAWVTTLIIWGILQPDPYAQGWRLVLELAFLGHVINIADGISNGFGNIYLLIQSGIQDIILVLVLYPWIVRAYQGMQARGLIGKTIDNFRRSA